MTAASALKRVLKTLLNAGIEDAQLEARALTQAVLKKSGAQRFFNRRQRYRRAAAVGAFWKKSGKSERTDIRCNT